MDLRVGREEESECETESRLGKGIFGVGVGEIAGFGVAEDGRGEKSRSGKVEGVEGKGTTVVVAGVNGKVVS